MKRHGTARWEGGFKNGGGYISTESGALLHAPYAVRTRFEADRGTNPEELIAAAHAACFSMALSKELDEIGFTVDRIETKAEVTLDKSAGGFAISKSELHVKACVPGCPVDKFDQAAMRAKDGCPVSKALRAEVTMKAELAGKQEMWQGEHGRAA